MSTAHSSSMPRSMRTFFIIWLGQAISLIGSSLTNFGLGVWIYQQTGQATPFALTALASTLPGILLSPFAGALVDRWDRRRVMILTDTGAALVTLVVLALLLSGKLVVWQIYILALVGSALSAFQEPAYMASITVLVPKEQFARASGLVQTGQAIGQLIAPVLGGALVVSIGLQGVIIIDLTTFLFAVGALLFIHIPRPEQSAEGAAASGTLLHEAAQGWHYIRARAGLLGILISFAAFNFLANIAAVTMAPLVLSFAQADVLGLVQSAGGAGMLIGSIVMSSWGGTERRIYTVYGALIVSSAGLFIAGLRPSGWVVGLGLFILLGGIPFVSAASQAIWQAKVPPDLQGRVFATRSVVSRSAMPIAYLLAGPLADQVFEPLLMEGGALASTIGTVLGTGPGRGMGLMFVTMGALCLLVTSMSVLHPRIRRVELEIPDYAPVAMSQTAATALQPGDD